jgi:hypothetical protein
MVASHACKGKLRYHYYISRDLQRAPDARTTGGWRLPAREIEPLVRARVAEALADPVTLVAALDVPLPEAGDFRRLLQSGQQLSDELSSRSRKGTALLRKLLRKVQLGTGEVCITLHAGQLATALQASGVPKSDAFSLSAAATPKRRGGGLKLVMPSGSAATPNVNLPLLQLIHRGRQWWQELQSDPELTLEAIGRREGLTGGYVIRLVRLAFLDPAILAAILECQAPPQLTSDALTGPRAVSLRWIDQRRDYCFSPVS